MLMAMHLITLIRFGTKIIFPQSLVLCYHSGEFSGNGNPGISEAEPSCYLRCLHSHRRCSEGTSSVNNNSDLDIIYSCCVTVI